MALSDKDMKMVSQIAYIDFGVDKNQISNYNLRELLYNSGEYESACAYLNDVKKSGNAADIKMAQDTVDLYNEIMDPNSKYGNWVIRDFDDRNADNGFYGCLIETGDGEAAIGFRGSEDMSDPENLIDDWIKADFGLLNSTETSQQESARNYMQRIADKYGDQYDSFELTGHSLGGNLAEHAAITAPDAIKGKIVRVLSIDGPGFSDEYIVAHKQDIDEVAGVLEHHQYSPVGALLNKLPGERYRTIQVIEEGETLENSFNRHSTAYIKYDENGNVINGTRDPVSAALNNISNVADDTTRLPGIYGALSFLPLILSPFLIIPSTYEAIKEIIREMKEYSERRREQSIAGKADFTVKPTLLANSSEEIKNYSTQINAAYESVKDIHREMSVVLKAASLFTICYRLNKYVRDLSKEKSKMDRMMTAARTCATCYTTSENQVVSGAVV